MSAVCAARPLRAMLAAATPRIMRRSRSATSSLAASITAVRTGREPCHRWFCHATPSNPSPLLPQFFNQTRPPHWHRRDIPASRGTSAIAHAKGKKKGKKAKKKESNEVPVLLEPESELDYSDDEISDEEENDSDMDFNGPTIYTGGLPWAEAGLKTVEKILQQPEMQGLELYSFTAAPAMKVLRVRLDKLEDEYGSPSLEDITTLARALSAGLEEELGEEEAGTVEVEVSSPGAERVLKLPGELNRFGQLPLTVEYELESGCVDTMVLKLQEYDEENGTTTWGLADVAANKIGKKKGQGLNRKERDMVFVIPVADIKTAHVHLDV